MKITIVCKYFSPRGGAQTFLANFVRHLAGGGHQVRIIAMEIEGAPDGVDVHVVPLSKVFKGLRARAFAREVERLLEEDDSELTFGEQRLWGVNVVRPGGGVHKEYMKQIIKSYPNVFMRALKSVTKRLSIKEYMNYVIERRLYAHPALRCVIANSKLVRDHLLKHYPGLEGKLHVVHNGADCERFSPELKRHRDQVRAELHIPQEALVGVFVSYDLRRKGLPTVMRALSILRRKGERQRVYVIVVGKEKGWAVRLAHRLGVSDLVRFAGPQAPDRYYGASDVMMLPSYFDPCANVTLEALACGLPVLTSVHNGAYELLTAGVNGFYVRDASDAAQFAGFIEHYMDAEKLAAASASARQVALAHTMDKQLGRIVDILTPLAARKAQEEAKEFDIE